VAVILISYYDVRGSIFATILKRRILRLVPAPVVWECNLERLFVSIVCPTGGMGRIMIGLILPRHHWSGSAYDAGFFIRRYRD
jgi:hypothetical protein